MKLQRNYDFGVSLPSEDEPYMCESHLSYFKAVLEQWREQAQRNLDEDEKRLSEEQENCNTDECDMAFQLTQSDTTLKIIDRHCQLLRDIESSLEDIAKGVYGKCKKTGKKIGIKRLLANPTAKFAIDVQQEADREMQAQAAALQQEGDHLEDEEEFSV